MTNTPTTLLIDSFFDTDAQGNRHTLLELKRFRAKAQAQAHSLAISPNILIELLRPKNSTTIELRFYQHGQEIMNCGSGTLAAAHYCREVYASLWPLMLHSAGGEFKVNQQTPGLGLEIKNTFLYQTKKIKQAFWQYALAGHSRIQPVRTVQQVRGYTIVEYPSATDIAALCPRFQLLANLQSHAIIATAAANHEHRADYVLRYFAPRFGNPEDAATGSANFILLPYWQRRLKKNKLCGLQLSPLGGRFWGECTRRSLSLFGQTRTL